MQQDEFSPCQSLRLALIKMCAIPSGGISQLFVCKDKL